MAFLKGIRLSVMDAEKPQSVKPKCRAQRCSAVARQTLSNLVTTAGNGEVSVSIILSENGFTDSLLSKRDECIGVDADAVDVNYLDYH